MFLAEAGSPHLYFEQDLKRPFALIIGNEAHGPSQEARKTGNLTHRNTISKWGGILKCSDGYWYRTI